MESASHSGAREPFWRYFFCLFKAGKGQGVPLLLKRQPPYLAPWLVVVITAVIGLGFDKIEVFRLIEMQGLDLQLFLSQPAPSADVFVVKITGKDYSNPDLFGRKSPLRPQIVTRVINAVKKLNPNVIGVDLNTTDPEWKSALCNSNQEKVLSKPGRKEFPSRNTCLDLKDQRTVIWAAIPEPISNESSYAWANKDLVVLPPAGGKLPNWDSFSGVPGFPQDSDGEVRNYVGQFTVNGITPLKSFAAAIAKSFRPGVRNDNKKHLLNFGSPIEFPAVGTEELLNCPSGKSCFKIAGDESSTFSPQGRIVLIGGYFGDARDSYETPRKRMAGVELNAMAIESDLHGGGIDEPSPWERMLADLLLGFGLVLTYWYFELKRRAVLALLLATMAAAAVAMFVSYIWFHVSAFCLPVLLGINIHQYWEHVVRAAKE